jgi:hypothetical protein
LLNDLYVKLITTKDKNMSVGGSDKYDLGANVVTINQSQVV